MHYCVLHIQAQRTINNKTNGNIKLKFISESYLKYSDCGITLICNVSDSDVCNKLSLVFSYINNVYRELNKFLPKI